MASSSTETDVAVLRRVEHVFGRIVASLCAEEPLVLTLKSKKPRSAAAATSDAGNPSEFQIRFPGRSPEEAWRFGKNRTPALLNKSVIHCLAVVLRVLGCIHEALVSNRTVSKRFGASIYPIRFCVFLVSIFQKHLLPKSNPLQSTGRGRSLC